MRATFWTREKLGRVDSGTWHQISTGSLSTKEGHGTAGMHGSSTDFGWREAKVLEGCNGHLQGGSDGMGWDVRKELPVEV